MYHFFPDGSYADDKILAAADSVEQKETYRLKRASLSNLVIPNRSLAWRLAYLPDDHPEHIKLKESINEYNCRLDRMEVIPGFMEIFASKNFCLSREMAEALWTEEEVRVLFSLIPHVFKTDLENRGDWLLDTAFPRSYTAECAGERLRLPIGKPAFEYPTRIGGKSILWNYTDNGHDFCFELWRVLGERVHRSDEEDENEDEVIYQFDAYEQFRDDAPEPQLVRIFHKLESLGYIETYSLYPESFDPQWCHWGKHDGSIDIALLDDSFFRNTLLREQVELLLWSRPKEIREKPYFLTDGNGRQYLSAFPGNMGGHRKLKIYGHLECPSAAKYLAAGKYIRNRVFFKSEETAIQAGYRPCAKCMPEAYRRWRAEHCAPRQR